MLLLGCNSNEEVKKNDIQYVIDPSVVEYVLDFQRDLESVGLALENDNISFSIILGKLPDTVAGMAIGMFNPYCVNIILDEDIWNILNRAERKALVYHELAHDVFELHHNTCDIMSGGLREITDEMVEELLDTLTKQQNK
jgi:hypothetical protein